MDDHFPDCWIYIRWVAIVLIKLATFFDLCQYPVLQSSTNIENYNSMLYILLCIFLIMAVWVWTGRNDQDGDQTPDPTYD